MKFIDNKTCTPKCRSSKHIQELIGLITRTNDSQIILSGFLQCWNCHKIADSLGRYLIHVAASCGRGEVCDWLIKLKKADFQQKTSENGWTPAHCASFYGQIDVLILLIKNGANLNKLDYDRLTPLEQISLDKWLSNSYQPDINDEFDVYAWGGNANYNLGVGHDMEKSNAEIVEFFKKQNVTIVEIVMSKFHTVFRSRSGEVYTCGFGTDGRLGHDNEITLVAPKQVEQLKNEKCVQICASRNNTYFLTSDGNLYSCGTNEFKQLGQIGVTKALKPQQVVLPKRLKGSRKIKQIECSRFHCVILTTTNEVFTFGLNAGQLGHPNEMVENNTNYNNNIVHVAEPRLITSLNEPNMEINLIACSEGCTICIQPTKNILHLFNDYKSKRLHYVKETGSSFKKIRVRGGKLDHSANPDLKQIYGLGDPILIVGLTVQNLLFVWRENDPVWRNMSWSGNKNLKIADFDLNNHGIIFTTLQGLCYKADFSSKSKSTGKPREYTSQTSNSAGSSESSKSALTKATPNLFDKTTVEFKTEVYEPVSIPFLNRCYKVACDLKSRNFFALQYFPNANMRNYPNEHKSTFKMNMKMFLDENSTKKSANEREESFDEYSYGGYSSFMNLQKMHDIELRYKSTVFGLHKFILFTRCQKFFSKIDISSGKIDLETHITQKYSLQSLEILINYIYTNECNTDFMKSCFKTAKITSEAMFLKFLNEFKELAVDKFGFNELKQSFDASNLKALKDLQINLKDNNQRFELMSEFLFKLLTTKSRAASSKGLKFSRLSYKEFYDCQIECNNNESINCHKCILIARSDYFRNMLLGSWLESSSSKIQIPFDADLLQIFIDFLYSDEILMDFVHSTNNAGTGVKSKNEKEVEVLFNLYVLSDQLLVERLKNLCEFKLVNLVNLKNIVEIFEFSNEFEAQQLKDYCLEFIATNLVTIIEAKQLESMNMKFLREISEFYQSYFPIVGSRRITPYDEGLDPNSVQLLPFDLIYDQRFVDGSFNDEKKIYNQQISTSPTFESPSERLENSQSDEKINETPVEVNGHDESQENAEKSGDGNQKWEKVKKKSRRKISENNQPIQQTNQTNDSLKPSNLNNNPKAIPVGAFYTEKDLEKYKQDKVKDNQSAKGEEEWPDLGETTEIPKKAPKPVIKPLKKPSPPINSKPINISKPVKDESTPTKTVAWGVGSATGITPKFSLLDVMNEEMKKVSIQSNNSQDSSFVSEMSTSLNQSITPVTKGWNLQSNSVTPSNSVNSFAKIIEMEKKSKEQYNKLKNRPLSSIQLEEKAIEDLKKLYDVDYLTSMTIKIELIDDADFENCAPLWKKK